ncbi:MAG: HAD family hydrolase [Candidatus Bathyarchaeia archaeon]
MIKAVLLDFDGTILDSMGTIHETLNILLKRHGLPEVDAEALGGMAGLPLIEILPGLIPGIDAEVIDEISREFFSVYVKISLQRVKPVPRVEEALQSLRRRGTRLAIVTTTPRMVVERELDRFKLGKYFDQVLTREDAPSHKPAPDVILKALRRLRIRAEEAAVVGDSPVDIRAGKAAGVRTIGVLTGLCGLKRLVREGPDLIIDSIADLPNASLHDP